MELEIIDISDNETRLNRERERRATKPKGSSITGRRFTEVMVSARLIATWILCQIPIQRITARDVRADRPHRPEDQALILSIC